MSTLEHKSWRVCIYYGYTNGEAASNLFNLYSIVLPLNSLNVNDSEEASSLESDIDVVYVECKVFIMLNLFMLLLLSPFPIYSQSKQTIIAILH